MLSALRSSKLACLPMFCRFLLVAFVVPLGASAENLLTQKLNIHGFIAQGVIESKDSDFVNDDKDLSFELTEIGINASYDISSTVRAAGQLVYINGGNRYAEGARLDYLLLDWSAYQTAELQLNVLAGRFKNYNWLYSSTRDVPHTRPSIILPQSIYFDGFRDIAVGGDGLALSLKQYSELLGEFEYNLSYGTSNISDKQTEIILSEFATGDMEHDNDVQASVFWQPTNTQWRLGIALLDADFSYDKGANDAFQDANITLQRYIFNALYEAERWEFSSELFQERFLLTGFYQDSFKRDNFGQGFFMQSRYQLTEDIKLLARFERFWADKDDRNGKKFEASTFGVVPAYFGYQHDSVLGLTYDLHENMQIQFEHHWFEGTARLTPVVLPNPRINDKKHWQVWAVQFMYWF